MQLGLTSDMFFSYKPDSQSRAIGESLKFNSYIYIYISPLSPSLAAAKIEKKR